jgi:hypothetical protein
VTATRYSLRYSLINVVIWLAALLLPAAWWALVVYVIVTAI